MEPDPGLAALVGSETRLRLLAVLANAHRPMTGYRVAKTGEVSISKTYPELSHLERAKLAEHRRTGWIIVDKDVARLLRKRLPISDSEDWFLDKPKRDAEDRSLLDRLEKLPPPDWSIVDSKNIRYDVSRRREKDALLIRHHLKPSVIDGRA
jgi:hypothetical protein